jgi:hypothetical protein
VSDSSLSCSLDQAELLGSGDRGNNKIDTSKCIAQLRDILVVNDCDLAAEVFFEFWVSLAI